VAMFFVFLALFVCKILKISKLVVEAAGVEPETSVVNAQLIDSENA
jgi:Na+-transporting methylmalonyl-CoA/oxaloacetate decarboxylase gamma subunit